MYLEPLVKVLVKALIYLDEGVRKRGAMADDDRQARAYDTAVKLDSVGECTEQWAVYHAGLMHQDSQSVIKVVRYGLNIACFLDEHAMELVEKQIAQQQRRAPEEHQGLV